MAYLDRRGNPNRTKIIVGVLCLEALAIYAVVRGLDVDFLPRAVEPPLTGEQFPLPPPPPADDPEVKPPVTPPTTTTIQPPLTPPIDVNPGTGPVIFDPGPITVPSQPPAPPISQVPRSAPKAARPMGNPANWVSTNDYPSADLRAGNQGTTGFELTVGTDGRVVACMVMRSSGFPGLDKATCDALSRRARFTPASDESGAKVTGRYVSSIRWVIPD